MKREFILLVLFVLYSCFNTAYSQQITLIPSQDNWKYLDNGSDQGIAWYAPAFDDSGWPAGQAQFGYGDGDEASIIGFGPNPSQKYITTYFRKSFVIANPASYTGYVIRLKRDDGAAVYINGIKVVNSNLSPVASYNTHATVAVNNNAENTFYSFPVNDSLFLPGNNVIAVEVHTRTLADADISFDLKLQAIPTCVYPSGLNSSGVTESSATLSWNAVPGAVNYKIRYRVSGSTTWISTSSTATSKTISSLSPGTTYQYRLRTNCGSELSAFSPIQTFTTLNTCETPGGLSASSVTPNSVQLQWNNVIPAINYSILYRVSGLANWTTVNSQANNLILQSLAPATTYEVCVQSHCSTSSSGLSSPVYFTTTGGIPVHDTLIYANANWKFSDNGALPPGAWKTLGYNDTGWNSGNAELGYGDGDESTVVSYGPSSSAKYITTYFRKVFNVTNATQYTSMSFQVVRDDGIVIYLNGNEIYRNNMPSGTIGNSTVASGAIGGAEESKWNSVTLSPSGLVNGDNILAVEIHQHEATSSDISLKCLLAGLKGSTVTRGPYLQMLQTTAITIRWRTNVATNSRVDFGTSLLYGNSAGDAALTTEHIVSLTGLLPNTKYYYRVGSTDQVQQGDDDNYFITAIPTGTEAPLRILATGDFGDGSAAQYAVRDAFSAYTITDPAHIWLWLGDNAYESGTDAEYQSFVFNVYNNQFKNIPLYPSIGNHDYGNVGYQNASSLGTGFPYFDIFTLPIAGEAGGVASGTEKFYSYNNANVHFIVLDSYGSYNGPGSAMYNWLQNDLASNTQRWTIVYFHHPPYTKGSHDSDTGAESIPIRQHIVPLFDTYNVDLVLSGHSHNNERSYLFHNHYGLANTFTSTMKVSNETNNFIKTPPYDGTIYAVCGTSGRSPGNVQPGWPMPCMYFTNNSNNCAMIIDVNGDVMNAKFLSSQGNVIDQFTITKTNVRLMDQQDDDNELNVYMNPGGNEINISFEMENEGEVELSLYDALGKSYPTSFVSKMFSEGLQYLSIENNLSPGIYFIKLRRGERVITGKIIAGY